MSCGVFQLRIGDTTLQSTSPHFRFEVEFRSTVQIIIRIPADTTILPDGTAPITDLNQHNALKELPNAPKPATYAYYPAYNIVLSTCRVTRAEKPPVLGGCHLVEVETVAASDARLEYVADFSGALPVPIEKDDKFGSQLAATMTKQPVKFECISVDGCYIGMLRDFRDFCEHVIKHDGYV
jgi:hypothetical protein